MMISPLWNPYDPSSWKSSSAWVICDPGSITAVTRRRGKPSCPCAKHDDPGPDPRFRLTRRVSGKTVTETFPNPTALHKAQQDSACRWRRLSGMLI
jgi:hypothetical protein